MASTAASQVPSAAASKNQKKKKTKGDAAAKESPKGGARLPFRDSSAASDEPLAAESGEGSSESSHVKELQKLVRNITKKLNAASKLEATISEYAGQSLDDLVAARKINNDQKAQLAKAPALKESLAQLEEQINTHKKVESEFRALIEREKATLRAAHDTEKKEWKQAVETAKDEGRKEAKDEEMSNLLVLTQFLRAAAAKRMEEELAGEAENRAFEGVLLLVYGGDETAIQAAKKLVSGAEEPVTATDGSLIPEMTYAHIRQASLAYGGVTSTETQSEEPQPIFNNDTTLASDPTIAHAGQTELDDSPLVNGAQTSPPTDSGPEQAAVGSDAANAVAESHWDVRMTSSTEGPDSWVEISPDTSRQEPASTLTSAANAAGQSWADDTPAQPQVPVNEPVIPPDNSNDGFHEVHHSRGGRGRGGSFSGDRGGGFFRGRGGYRGEGGGYRGRGGYRGDRGSERGAYRSRGRGGRGAYREGGEPRREAS
ncbi:MAG: hypothetical protein M1814_005954 [Vezdaea aestivalis]|nr:MAG: hypothetical protein M1814_005954 [Vezdaea aestivalis]